MNKEEAVDEHISVQLRTFMNWINFTTGKKILKSDNLLEKISDGVLLIELVQSLAPNKKMPGR